MRCRMATRLVTRRCPTRASAWRGSGVSRAPSSPATITERVAPRSSPSTPGAAQLSRSERAQRMAPSRAARATRSKSRAWVRPPDRGSGLLRLRDFRRQLLAGFVVRHAHRQPLAALEECVGAVHLFAPVLVGERQVLLRVEHEGIARALAAEHVELA